MNICTKQVASEKGLHFLSVAFQFADMLTILKLIGIKFSDTFVDPMIEQTSELIIKPLCFIIRDFLEKETHHKINIMGDGQKLQFKYLDCDCTFYIIMSELNDMSCDLHYYGLDNSDAVAKDFVWAIEALKFEHQVYDMDEALLKLQEISELWGIQLREKNRAFADYVDSTFEDFTY